MATIQLKNVIKRYGAGKGANQVIHGVNADIRDGEFVVIAMQKLFEQGLTETDK